MANGNLRTICYGFSLVKINHRKFLKSNTKLCRSQNDSETTVPMISFTFFLYFFFIFKTTNSVFNTMHAVIHNHSGFQSI